MIKGKGKSLYFILGLTFFIVISISMVIQISYSYIKTEDRLKKNLIEDIEVTSFQLEKLIIPFIESYQVTEYETIVENSMSHEDILAIIVEDYLTGKIISSDSYVTGLIKNEDFSIQNINLDDEKQKVLLNNSITKKRIDLKKANGEKIGSLIVYGTDYFIEKELKNLILDNLFITILIYSAVFFIFYFSIKANLIDPINNIVNSLSFTRNNEIIYNKIDEHSSKEFSFLTKSINTMVEQIVLYNNELKQSEFRWQFAVEGSGDGLWDWNIKTNQVFFSKKWKSMLGFEENEIKGSLEEWEKRVHPDDLEQVFKDIQKHLEGETLAYQNEHRVKCKDGSYKWILDRGIIVQRDKEGKPLRLIGTHTDISERKKYEKEMKQALLVFENTHDGIMITNAKNEILSINPAFTKTTGYTLDEVKYNNPSILKSFAHEKEFYKTLWSELQEKGTWSGEITNKTKEGNIYEELLTINTIKNEGKVEGYIGVFSDVSILKQQEKMLLQQARTSAVGEMLGNIAHQWRQPLSAVSTAATGLKVQLQMGIKVSDENIVNILTLINEQAQYLSNTIEDFRNFFKDDISKTVEFSVSEVLNKVYELTVDSFKINFVELHCEIVEDIYVEGNPNLLTQVLINIYNNAMDALKEKEGKRLFFISLQKQENKVVISLKDNAGGIEDSILEKIFEPYFTTKHESVGTGLGLYMSHQIVSKQLNGTLKAQNSKFKFEKEEYKGAEFIITLKV